MKGLILCAGKGTRLRPLTYTAAKHLIPLANKPILFYALEALVEAGIRDIGIVVGEQAEDIQKAVGDGAAFGASIQFATQSPALGLAHAVACAQEFVGLDDFMLYLGDNVFGGSLRPLAERFAKERPAALLSLGQVADPRSFGIAELEGPRVTRLVEKPREPRSNWAVVGVYLFSNVIMEAIQQIKPSARGEYEITDAVQYLIEQGHTVIGQPIEFWWKDTGRPADVIEANRAKLAEIVTSVAGSIDSETALVGQVQVDQAARVSRSLLRGPVMVGPECEIADCYLGPYTSIGRGARLKNCEVENSIIMEGAEISGIRGRIDSSIIGRYVILTRKAEHPRAHRFVIADHSQIEVD